MISIYYADLGQLVGHFWASINEQNIDLKKAISFPIHPIPLMLGSVDGSMNTTAKSALVHHLEKHTQELQYEYKPDIVLIDFMSLL